MADEVEEKADSARDRKSSAGTIASGIFASRIMGFVREAAVAFYFGIGAHTDVFQAAFRAPNLLQNLLGEGTISAAFIPVYSRMLAEGREEDAGRFAGAVFTILLVLVSGLVLLGILLARPLVAILVPGYVDDAQLVAAGELPIDRYEMIVAAVRIIFPMTGMLVLSAWALGILNSHRRFLVPYFAPVIWNVSIIGSLVGGAYYFVADPLAGGTGLGVDVLTNLLFTAFFGALVGGILQFAVQLPLVARLVQGFRFSLSTRIAGVMESIRAFGPVVAGRGVYQLSAYLDMFLASWLGLGALAALRPAQMLYILPVSLFGLSVAASELPELSRLREEQLRLFLGRLTASVRQTLFLIVPTFVGYLAFGLLIVGAFFRRGAFGANDTWLVYLVLGGYSLGLLATTISRLLQNAFYAISDTKTPAVIAVVRVVVSTAVAVPLMLWLRQFSVTGTIGVEAEQSVLNLGAVGLAVGASVGAWIELWRLRRSLQARLTDFHLPVRPVALMIGMAIVAVVPSAAVWFAAAGWPTPVLAISVIAVYGASYLALAKLRGMDELDAWAGRFLSRFSKS